MAKTSVQHFDPERFRKLRLDAGLTITELARKSNVHRITVSQWERGVSKPSIELLRQVLDALGKDSSDVLTITPMDVDLGTLRVLAGLTRDEVATALGISNSTWGEIERGGARLSLERVPVLASLFGVTQAVILRAAQRSAQ